MSMQDPCCDSNDGFAAVRAKWKQNANKFGSPLPGCAPLKKRISPGHDSDEAGDEEDPSLSKPEAETGLGDRPELAENNEGVVATSQQSLRRDPAKQRTRKASVSARWDAGQKAQSEESAAKALSGIASHPFLK